MKKILAPICALSLVLAGAFADEDDFSFDSLSSFGDDSASESPVTVGGTLCAEGRAYFDTDTETEGMQFDSAEDLGRMTMSAGANARVGVRYSGTKADGEVTLNFSPSVIKDHPEDVIDELVVRGYMGNFMLEAGKMKVVWGKGDKLHVIDNFNADDYTDFIIPDYIDRRISTPMLRGVYSLPSGALNMEAVYTPFMPVDRFATSGAWVPSQLTSLTEKVTAYAEDYVAESFTRYTTATAAAGTLNALYAEKVAAETAYKTAVISAASQAAAFQNTNVQTAAAQLAASESKNFTALTEDEQKAYLTRVWNSFTDEQKAPFVTECTANYDTILASQQTALEAGLRTAGYGYIIDNQTVAEKTYDAACSEAGFTKDSIEAEVKAAGTEYMTALTNASLLSADTALLYPDTNKLKYGQAGLRLTGTAGAFDWGASYYYGHYKQPSVNEEKIKPFVEKYLAGTATEEDKFLAYDMKQTFGLEAATVLWHFNVRGEAAFNLTEDTEGTNPAVHNNSLAWLAGFDIDLPINNLNVNVQETGTFILGSDKIKDSATPANDVDYNANDAYTKNRLVVNVTDSYMNDRIQAEATLMWGMENGDIVLMPKLTYKPMDTLALSLSGAYLWCRDENSEFYGWKDNSFVNLGASISF